MAVAYGLLPVTSAPTSSAPVAAVVLSKEAEGSSRSVAPECLSLIAEEFVSRPLYNAVLEEEESGKEEAIASAQVGINLAMAMEHLFGSLAVSPTLADLVIQGEPTRASIEEEDLHDEQFGVHS